MILESTLTTGFHQEGRRNASLPEGKQSLLEEIQDSSTLTSRARDHRELSTRRTRVW